MKINILKRDVAIIIAECVWHGYWNGWFITPALRFDKLSDYYFTFDIVWLKLYITFGFVKHKSL